MSPPENSVYIVLGEVNLLVTAMRRNSRWTSPSQHDEEQDPLLQGFSQLKRLLNTVSDINELAPSEFLRAFLEVIKSEDTTGPITGLALSSVNKFLSYGLIDTECDTAAAAIEHIADAVTHARFVGTDPSADEVVLMKILHVLRTLLLTPAGAMLTNESVCEIMQSCFRICFEMRLSELLRKSAEHTLMDMVQLLFSRLPQFHEDARWANLAMKKLKMRAGGMDSSRSGKLRRGAHGSKHKGVKGVPHQSPRNRHSTHKALHNTTASEGVNSPSETTADTGSDSAGENVREIISEKASKDEDPERQNIDREVPPPSTLPVDELNCSDEFVEVDRVTIATTPVAGNSVVDMQETFQDTDGENEQSYSSFNTSSVLAADPDPANSDTDLAVTSDAGLALTSDARSDGNEENRTVFMVNSEELTSTERNNEDGKPPDADQASQEGLPQSQASDSLAPASPHVLPDDASVDYVNNRGVRFTPDQQGKLDENAPLIPYGLPCVRELFRFLVSLTNPIDRHNTDVMIHMGLSLLTVALEVGADHIPTYTSLLALIKDDMCKNLFFLLQAERLSLFAASMRVCFLLFEAMRSHLKLQLEAYLIKLQEIIVSESPRIMYEQRELALESIVQLLRVPGLVTELYLNYDCNLHCTNLFEDLMKLLSKNAFPVSGLYSTHILSLDALLAVIDSIEQHCHHRLAHATDSNKPQPHANPQNTEGEISTPADGITPAPSGYTMAQNLANQKARSSTPTPAGSDTNKDTATRRTPKIRPNRMKVAETMPSEEELAAVKHKKKLYQMGTEQFNIKPSKGIEFLMEHKLLPTPLDPTEVVAFIKANPKLDKKMLGEYISNKKNGSVLEAYQKSFNFDETRVDEALRMYLETFRLPGEAPVIQYLLEHFAEHWHKTNGEPFANADAAFTLAYAIIMLNVDQHNTNAKKQNIPMTNDEFKRNLKKVNGGEDFDQDMLDETYAAIKEDEIVMPAEQVGLVKENYLWKLLIRRGAGSEGHFMHVPTGAFDRELFSIVWGPTVAALSFIFDKSLEEAIIQKAVSGFRKCAMISAHYSINDVFDNLVISLCKFTTFLSAVESAESIAVTFGNNGKAQLAARTVFSLAHTHGHILREGWKNITDCLMQLYRAKLLPDSLIKVEDFLDPSGKVSLIRDSVSPNQRSESGVLSSFYSYFVNESTQQRGPSVEEQEAIRRAKHVISECQVDRLITDSKFLIEESLHELIKALVAASRSESHDLSSCNTGCTEEAAVFFLELLIKVVLQNRDRIVSIWQTVRDHLYELTVNSTEQNLLLERAVIGLLRLAIRLLRREEIASQICVMYGQVLASLRMLLVMRPGLLHSVCRHVAFGLHELLRTNAANIHSTADWYTLFTLLEVVGAGTSPPPILQQSYSVPEGIADAAAMSDSEVAGSEVTSEPSDRGYTSDSELYSGTHNSAPQEDELVKPGSVDVKPLPAQDGNWLMVYNKEEESDSQPQHRKVNQFSIVLHEDLAPHDTKSLVKCCETLSFLVRDAAHITPHNFESCVHTIRVFVEASIDGGVHHMRPSSACKQNTQTNSSRKSRKHKRDVDKIKKSKSSPSHLHHMNESDEEKEPDSYSSISIQLLDLMHTLHTRAATIFSSWAEETPEGGSGVKAVDAGTSTLWVKCWCPLLQGIARLCCDVRRNVRSQALTYLQRALLVHDLQTLSAREWENCFNKVLFPLLSKLLASLGPRDPAGVEETRMRASTLLCKVFLQHLTPLLSLTTFTALWLTILDFMDKYMHADRSELLGEAIPESLKNMLLVMHTAGILSDSDQHVQLWRLTWDRIHSFLPRLQNDVFKPHQSDSVRGVREAVTEQPEQTSTQNLHPAADELTKTTPAAEPVASQATPIRPESPLTAPPPALSLAPYVLHPPLPSHSMAGSSGGTVPILLNPDIMQGTSIPIITPQGVTEHVEEKVGH